MYLHALGFLPWWTPHIQSVPSDQYSRAFWVILHSSCHGISQFTFMTGILDDRYHKFIIVPQVWPYRSKNLVYWRHWYTWYALYRVETIEGDNPGKKTGWFDRSKKPAPDIHTGYILTCDIRSKVPTSTIDVTLWNYSPQIGKAWPEDLAQITTQFQWSTAADEDWLQCGYCLLFFTGRINLLFRLGIF